MRLPRWAEKYFSLCCTEHDAVCSPPDEDINGWDYLVEFPPDEFEGPLESSPILKKAFIQVKSTKSINLKTQIKLSNMLKATRSPDPWFIVLIAQIEGSNEVNAYMLHVWDNLIGRSLKAVRKANLEGAKLHQRTLSISFPQWSKLDKDLVPSMLQVLKEQGADYANEKISISNEVGYENGHGVGKLKVSANSERELIDSFLGIGESLESTEFSFTPERFGLPDNKPEVSGKAGKVIIEPQPIGDCTCRVRGNAHESSLSLPGKIYGFNFGGMVQGKGAVRFSIPPMEIVHRMNQKPEFKFKFSFDKDYDLAWIRNLSILMKWLSDGEVDVEIWRDGRRMLAGKITPSTFEKDDVISFINSIIGFLTNISVAERHPEVLLSLEDFYKTAGLSLFRELTSYGSLRAEFPKQELPDKEFSAMLYFVRVIVKNCLFGCIVKREVTDDHLNGENRTVTFGRQPLFLETYVYQNPTTDQLETVESDYERFKGSMEENENPIFFGDLIEFLNNLNQAEKS